MDMRRRLTYLAVVLITISIVIAVIVPRRRGSEASRPDPAASGPWFDIAFTTPAETDQPGTHYGGIDTRLVSLVDDRELVVHDGSSVVFDDCHLRASDRFEGGLDVFILDVGDGVRIRHHPDPNSTTGGTCHCLGDVHQVEVIGRYIDRSLCAVDEGHQAGVNASVMRPRLVGFCGRGERDVKPRARGGGVWPGCLRPTHPRHDDGNYD